MAGVLNRLWPANFNELSGSRSVLNFIVETPQNPQNPQNPHESHPVLTLIH